MNGSYRGDDNPPGATLISADPPRASAAGLAHRPGGAILLRPRGAAIRGRPLLSSFDVAALLFVLAAVIGVANERWFGLPRPIALLIGAIIVSLGILFASDVLSLDLQHRTRMRLVHSDLPDVLLDGVLALLLFAASLQVDLVALRRHLVPIVLFSTMSVVIAMLLFGFGMFKLFALAGVPVPLAWCFVLGAILAPTDAVAVEQLLHRVKMPESLRAMISGESLFNDGAAVVLFFAALAAATGLEHETGHGEIALHLIVASLGAIALGAATGFVAAAAVRRIVEPALVVTVSLGLILATYRLAAWLEISGPVAVVVCGLVFYNAGGRRIETLGHGAPLKAFWSIIDDLVNTLLFLIMGFELLAIRFTAVPLILVGAAILMSLFVRFASIALPMLLARRPEGGRAPAIAVLTWTGLRGGISLALVLGLPEGPYRDELAMVCYAVVLFTVLIQGLSTPALVRRLYSKG